MPVPGKTRPGTTEGTPSKLFQSIPMAETLTRYSNLLNQLMNGNTVPNTAEATHSDKNKALGVP